jgi:hypothetical protein
VQNIAAIFSFLMLSASGSAWAHPGESRVSVELDSAATVSAGQVELRFELVDLKLKTILEDKDIHLSHEKKIHLFLFDPALKEFIHIHPTFDGTLWKVSTELKVNGDYWVWAQGQLESDGEEFAGSSRLMVKGGKPANAPTPICCDVRQGTDGISGVRVSNTHIAAGEATMLTLEFYRTDGTAPVITPYLGAKAHVVVTPEDGDSLVHVHPMQHGSTFMLHTKFEEAGGYRAWVQFVDGGVLKTVALSLLVK